MKHPDPADLTRDVWAETTYPLTSALGIRITTGPTRAHPPGIPHEHLKERLAAVGKWADWQRWAAGGLTRGSNGTYPSDVEDFLAGRKNFD